MALFLVTDLLAELFFEREKQVEGDVRWLELLGFGVSDVVGQGAVAGDAWGGGWLDVVG